MKKLILSTLLAFSFSFSSLFALSWSGLLDDNSTLSSNYDFSVISLNQSNGLYLSLNSDITKDGNLQFAAEALYKYFWNVDLKNGGSKFTNIVDCDLLKLYGSWAVGKGSFSFNAGRFLYSDFSSSVFSQISDGLYLSYDSLKVNASLYAGYTGLLNRLNVSMIDNEFDSDDQFYKFCPGYVPLAVDLSYKALFETNTIGVQAECFIPVSSKNVIKGYGTLSLAGHLGTIGNYSAAVVVGTEKFKDIMLDAKLDTGFFLGQSSMLSLGGEYISGVQGEIKPFITISSRSVGHSGFYNGVIVPKASIMFVANRFYASATEMVIISLPEKEGKLDGFDTGINILYNLFSDLQIGCDVGFYICKDDNTRNNFSATLRASLAF